MRLLLALAGLLAACSPIEKKLCDYECECEGCSHRQYDDCLRNYDFLHDDADYRGCLHRYDDLLACEDDTGRCDGFDWKTSCKRERDALDRCLRD